MNKNITIKVIAEKLNISASTVSRALRDRPHISKKNRVEIKNMAKKLKYVPNNIAQSLKTGKTKVLGVILPEIKHHFFSTLISGIENVAYKKGYVILVAQSNEDMKREVLNINTFISNNVAGVIVSVSQTTNNSEHFKLFMDKGGVLVLCDRICKDLDTSTVTVDDYAGAFKATEHLIKKGYSKIGHLGGSRDISITEARYQGYQDALHQNNIEIIESYIQFRGFHEINGKEGMKYLLGLENRPDAVFAVNDPVALGAYDVIKGNGLKIPQDIAIVGFSNNPFASLVDPDLTTVNQPAFEMGKKAVELLIEQIENRTGEFIQKHEVLKTNLIIRNST